MAATERPHPLIGRQIGSYQVLALLGRGGMGEVYRARDVKLGREVAIKVLPVSVATDPERLARFEREAHVLAALNHPHVAVIHGLEDLDGIRALVLELVEGRTAEDLIGSGPLPVRQALPIARQVADALDAAHDSGIVHRDLKPANIKVRPDGHAKVLDFGLAKALDTGREPDSSRLPTLTSDDTRDGLVLGTTAYMSPEQARGQRVDKRSDIWAFGCVLFEMLAGRRAFQGETISDTIAAVLEREPDWSALPSTTPEAVQRLLRRCLEKDARRRLHDIADARIEIDDALMTPANVQGAPSRHGSSRVAWLLAGAALSATVAAIVFRVPNRAVAEPASIQVQRLTDLVGLEEMPAISPDGRIVAFAAVSGTGRQIFVRLLAGGAPLALTRNPVDHYGPRWAPDSGSIIYYTPGAQPGENGTIWETPALGGPARRLVDALGPGDVSHDGMRIAFARFSGGAIELATANRDGTGIRPVGKLPAGIYYTPKWSPDDRHIAMVQDLGGTNFATSLIVVEVESGTARRVEGDNAFQGLAWTRDGSALVVSSAQGSAMSYPPSYNLWAVPIAGGPPTQLTFGESSYEFPDLGAQGQIVVSRVRAQSDVWKFPILDDPAESVRSGVRITRQTGTVQTVSINPEETEVAFLSDNGGHANVWAARIADGEMRPVTRESDPRAVVAVPVWSPRGDWINFISNRASPGREVTMWLVRPDGSGARDLGVSGVWVCWSPDGRSLYFSSPERGAYRLKKMPIEGGTPAAVRDDANAVGCQTAADGSAFYYATMLTQATGAWNYEIRRAVPENGPSELLGFVAGTRVPATAINFHAFLSPDGSWLAMPLLDGSTTNLWALSTKGRGWRKLTDFGARNVTIARRIAWSRDGRHLYAAVSDVDSDIVMLSGLESRLGR
jgi:Tol biopolymer transport system component